MSALFEQHHTDGKTVDVLKSARRCHVGTIVKAPAGAQQGQPAHHAQPGQPGHQGENVEEDDDWTGAEKRRREEARKRRLRKAYNPLKQDPDDADEYPADAVAMGYLPDLEGRRWRERRMRLSRFIQYNDSPAVEEEDLDPIATSLLDMDFAKEIWYKRNLKGGEARGCTGSFRAARPPPPRSQLRPRQGGAAAPGGHHHHQQPPPRDPPDSDADSDDDDDDDAPGAPVVRGQVQVGGRVREWFPSNSNRTVLHLATPPVTPQNHPAQQTVRLPIQPPAPPPQHPQQRSREEEEEIDKKRKARELAEAQDTIRRQQKSKAVTDAMMDKVFPTKNKPEATGTGLETQQNTQQATESQEKRARKVRDVERERQSAQRREEARKKEQEERRKQKEAAAELERLRAQQAQRTQEEAKRRQEEEQRRQKEEADRVERQRAQREAQKKQKEEEEELKRQRAQQEAQKKAAAKRADEERRKKMEAQKLEAQKVEDMRKETQQITREQAERVRQEMKEKEEREEKERQDSQAAIQLEYRRARFARQQERIQNFREQGYTLKQARTTVGGLEGSLEKDPDKKPKKSPWPALPKWSPIKFQNPLEPKSPKRPAETTQEDEDPNKKVRKDETQQNEKGQAGGGSSSKFSDKRRPWKEGEEPWRKPEGAGQKLGSGAEGLTDDDDDWAESADELAAPGVTTVTRASTGSGGPAQTPRADVPDLPSDVPGRTTTTGTPQKVPTQSSGYGTVPPATGIPTTKTTRSGRSGRRRGPGLAPGAQIPDDIKKLMREHARKK